MLVAIATVVLEIMLCDSIVADADVVTFLSDSTGTAEIRRSAITCCRLVRRAVGILFEDALGRAAGDTLPSVRSTEVSVERFR
jgi:hypothetical protein